MLRRVKVLYRGFLYPRAKISVLAYIDWQEVSKLDENRAASVCPCSSQQGKRIQLQFYNRRSLRRLTNGHSQKGGARLHWQVGRH